MTLWTRRPQEQAGTYRFDGILYTTNAVKELIPIEQVLGIVLHIREMVQILDGLDKLPIYDNYAGLTLYIIDELNVIGKIESLPEDNFFTMFFDWEY